MAQTCPTTKLERLILPTDGSEFSEGAIREAISLAKQQNVVQTGVFAQPVSTPSYWTEP